MGDISQTNAAAADKSSAIRKLTFHTGLIEVNFKIDPNDQENAMQEDETNTISN